MQRKRSMKQRQKANPSSCWRGRRESGRGRRSTRLSLVACRGTARLCGARGGAAVKTVAYPYRKQPRFRRSHDVASLAADSHTPRKPLEEASECALTQTKRESVENSPRNRCPQGVGSEALSRCAQHESYSSPQSCVVISILLSSIACDVCYRPLTKRKVVVRKDSPQWRKSWSVVLTD